MKSRELARFTLFCPSPPILHDEIDTTAQHDGYHEGANDDLDRHLSVSHGSLLANAFANPSDYGLRTGNCTYLQDIFPTRLWERADARAGTEVALAASVLEKT